MHLLYKYLLQTPITSSSYTTSFKVINFYMLFTEKLLSLRHLYLFPLLSDLAQHVALLSCNLKLVIISHSFHGQKYFYIEKYFFTVKHLQLIHSQTFYILLSFFLSFLVVISSINSRVKQPGKPKIWNQIKPGSLAFIPLQASAIPVFYWPTFYGHRIQRKCKQSYNILHLSVCLSIPDLRRLSILGIFHCDSVLMR